MTSLLNFINIYQLVQNLRGGGRQTDRMVMSLAHIFFPLLERKYAKNDVFKKLIFCLR
jgi:hypothetical protein